MKQFMDEHGSDIVYILQSIMSSRFLIESLTLCNKKNHGGKKLCSTLRRKKCDYFETPETASKSAGGKDTKGTPSILLVFYNEKLRV